MNKHESRKRRGLKAKALIKKSGKARLVVFRSSKHIYSQIVKGSVHGDIVLVSCSTNDKELRAEMEGKNKIEQATLVGQVLSARAKDNGITESVAFDRAGYKFHGRVKALAEGASEVLA